MPKVMLDREREFRLDLNAMVRFEAASGKSLLQRGLDNMTAADMRALLWAGLVQEDKELTIEQVGALVTPQNMADINRAIVGGFGGEESPFDVSGPGASSTPESAPPSSGVSISAS